MPPVIFDGPSGALEGIIDEPADFAGTDFAVVCHPHPLFGGTMTNKVAHTVARAFTKCGIAALRFNFRGAGASAGVHDNGVGETDDALAVIRAGAERWPNARLWLAGFSFGSFVALRVNAALTTALFGMPASAGGRVRWPPLVGLITVAPPVGRWDFSDTKSPACPWLIIQGDTDELVAPNEVVAWSEQMRPVPQRLMLAGATHFFHGQLHHVSDAVLTFVRSHQRE